MVQPRDQGQDERKGPQTHSEGAGSVGRTDALGAATEAENAQRLERNAHHEGLDGSVSPVDGTLLSTGGGGRNHAQHHGKRCEVLGGSQISAGTGIPPALEAGQTLCLLGPMAEAPWMEHAPFVGRLATAENDPSVSETVGDRRQQRPRIHYHGARFSGEGS
eukprot:3938096-Rhodomonas_salina.2